MADGTNEPVEDAADPAEDTPQDEPESAAEDTPEPEQPDDWEARYREAQKVIGRQGRELARWRRGQQSAQPEPDDETDEDDGQQQPAGAPDEYVGRLEAQSWDLAERLYGAEAVDAFNAAAELVDRAVTPADYLAAFEAYHEIRSGGGQKPQPKAKPSDAKRTRDEAIQPRVDPNTPDAGPSSIDPKLEEARSKGDLKGFIGAATRAMGFKG